MYKKVRNIFANCIIFKRFSYMEAVILLRIGLTCQIFSVVFISLNFIENPTSANNWINRS